MQSKILILSLSMTLALGGCAGIENYMGALTGNSNTNSSGMDDQTRTRVEGTALGATLGGLAGNLIGDNTNSTLIGSTLGAGIGYVVADEVAKRKQAYKNQEELIATESQRTEELTRELKQVNSRLKVEITAYRSQISKLQKQAEKDASKKTQLSAQKALLDARYKESQQALKGINNELEVTQSLYTDAKSQATTTDQSKLNTWNQRISMLKQEKTQLEQQTNQLQALSSEIAV
ncbi:hypothetical protein BegalDRAFT_2983 [Beggiatoa alba B18LD]|uniref:Glycine zipper 2TM domain-containing protein n=1 Tax=Beggiatoa alba B18LD TaxID=395493 RepID=I3CJL8_9GAMM|nr:glycine zipper 2TM domain-containing protein [Beggiatoa alba]EIJ43811.1 hypothetical protein BegalDRAFT_2983 [Beggiatoa alba B18LD]